MKTIIAIGLVLLSTASMAGMRCNGQLIENGDPVHKMTEACGEPTAEHQVGTGRYGSGDESYTYYEKGNKEIEVHNIDGHVANIDGNR